MYIWLKYGHIWPYCASNCCSCHKAVISFSTWHDACRAAAEVPAGVRGAAGARSRAAGSSGATRLPSEAELVRTLRRVAHHRGPRGARSAARRARRAARRIGDLRQERAARRRALSFGLLIPDLGETEIFEPICQGMMASPLARKHALVWGSPTARARRRRSARGSSAGSTSSAASRACSSRRSSSTPDKDDINQRIADALDAARHSRRAARPHRRALSRTAAATISSASTTAAPAIVITEHLLRLGSAPDRVRRRCRTPRRRSTRARPATARRCTSRNVPVDRGAASRASIRPTTPTVARVHGRRAARRHRLRQRSHRGAADADAAAARLRDPARRPAGRHRRRRVREPAAGAADDAAAADARDRRRRAWRDAGARRTQGPAGARHPARLPPGRARVLRRFRECPEVP